ncbi:hypothetical protein NHL50_08615 [Acidimicrobiia bacterium EGI L10123]|uniref:hypothetical protein n=1 Tax=Salinilacustrithrix flava TaxID=2957203 RepID=UPI003D7C34E8|nr:hypothetical protein [Acidimicrobiia bacterium EGI L10123]
MMPPTLQTTCAEVTNRFGSSQRVGNAYYSFLRELYVVALLRDRGVDARFHPLADALFRVDLWVDRTNVSLFIGNNLFRSSTTGCKDRPELFLADASPPFQHESIQLPVQHRFGVVHLPEVDAVRELASRLPSRPTA